MCYKYNTTPDPQLSLTDNNSSYKFLTFFTWHYLYLVKKITVCSDLDTNWGKFQDPDPNKVYIVFGCTAQSGIIMLGSGIYCSTVGNDSIKSSVAEPQPVAPKLFEIWSRNCLFNKYLLQSLWRMLGWRKTNFYLHWDLHTFCGTTFKVQF